jgi:hypothetical protein
MEMSMLQDFDILIRHPIENFLLDAPTLGKLDVPIGKEPSSIHVSQSRNSLTEPSLRLTIPPSPPDPPNEAFLKADMREEWSNGVRHFFEEIWIS